MILPFICSLLLGGFLLWVFISSPPVEENKPVKKEEKSEKTDRSAIGDDVVLITEDSSCNIVKESPMQSRTTSVSRPFNTSDIITRFSDEEYGSELDEIIDRNATILSTDNRMSSLSTDSESVGTAVGTSEIRF